MKTYHVSFSRTEWSNHRVEADNPAEAEVKAWAELKEERFMNGDPSGGIDYEVAYVEEETP